MLEVYIGKIFTWIKARQGNVMIVALKLKYVQRSMAATECEKENVYLLFSTFITGLLWLLSEIIGSSKCKAGGVFEFMINGYCVEISRENRNESVIIVESTSLLIESENV